ncbi:E3 ubiquitin/ISG15 ligase TRIM25-like [Dendropsophus ebraccatus]|uniref:E3 ubiquitin/ISG15 ligase TRIM25-like n=1 Tax=Dendropsophus ebraccatus TaxID=150705 RepID=UPI003831B96D
MASAELREELDCSICLSLYTDPVSLRCGHNFCRSCIVQVLDTQDGAGGYSCPDCRAEYPERPALEKNRKLGNIVERFLSTYPDMEETRIFCTYCTKSPVPAVKSCLQCENSLCDDHLTAHNKMVDHILAKPTGSFGNKKCPIHKKVLEYYCAQDAACLCVSCCLVGEHRGHQVELLDAASEEKKKKLRKNLDELNPQKAKIQTRVQNLHDRKRNIQEKASVKRENVTKLFMDIKEQLEMAENKALSEISRQEEEIVSQISDLIKKLKITEDELSRKMRYLEEMCQVTDPIRVLQEPDITVCDHVDGEDTGEDGGKVKSQVDSGVYTVGTKVQDKRTDPKPVLQQSDQGAACIDKSMVGATEAPVCDLHEMTDDLDEVVISLTLHRSMRDIVTNVTSQLGFQVPDILLDEDTASVYVKVSEDLKMATRTEEEQERPELPGRFLNHTQVLSRCGFSSGRHYWEVEWDQIGGCGIGVSYPSIEKEGEQSCIISNDKSWCFFMCDEICGTFHNSVTEILNVKPTCPTLGVFLDYEAGRLSFYELCDPIRHLHTLTASFSEPLHVILYVERGASVTIG